MGSGASLAGAHRWLRQQRRRSCAGTAGWAADDETHGTASGPKPWASTYWLRPRLIRRAVKHFQANGGGILITISSWAAQRGGDQSGTPSPTPLPKAAVTVDDSDRGAGLCQGRNPRLHRRAWLWCVRRCPSRLPGPRAARRALPRSWRWVSGLPPSDIAALVAFLASGRSRHLSGATLDVNGASYVR